ncbi:hypothetical protein OHA72_35130 [Dactylosporangium sp. NBC_01737]|uniref:hypothetical protein n=1 Tax=Dactylosporangium sp. NBC_01737 TaxID=2975959 RepID=UPI002E0F8E5E|nr:hypothetical protein OHA72_35130 [Dactylosporangium sp. NBC_01737]
MEADRFRDPGTGLHELAAAGVDVVCPRCASRAVVTPQRRFVCAACGATASWSPGDGPSLWGAPVDPYFRHPLWLTARCCGGRTLWAFNDAHLTLLENSVAARLREGAGMTLLARLPAWLTSAKHRDEVLRVIARLRRPHAGRSR